MPAHVVDVAPLYAGESVRAMTDVVPAADAVRLLSPSGS
jgi:hypothetical protein